MAESNVPGTRIRGPRKLYGLNLRIPAPLREEFYGGKEWLRDSLRTDSKSAAEKAVTLAKARFIQQAEELERRATLAEAFESLPPDQRAIFDEAGSVEALRAQHERSAIARAFLVAGGALTEEDLATDAPTTFERADVADRHKTQLRTFDDFTTKEAKTLRALGDDVKDPEVFGLRELIEVLEGFDIVKPGTVNRWRMVADRFIDFAGDLPLKELTIDQLREFTTAYRQLPAQQNTKELRNLNFNEQVAVAKAKKLETLSEETVRQHIGAIKALMPHAISTGYLAADPWTHFKLLSRRRKNSESKEPKRLPFTPEMVEATFADAASRNPLSVDRWGPFLAAYMGARIGEICQILGKDVIQIGETWCVWLTDADDRQTTKNAPSVRLIPIHQALLDAGFIDFVKQRPDDDYLFQNETAKGLVPITPDKNGHTSIQFSGRFNKRLRTSLGITDHRFTFHSYRHLWEDCATDVGMPITHNLEIAGRSKQEALGSKAGYGQGPRVKKLKLSMDKIDPTADLEELYAE
ncbi:phage integrase SAM-like domain-containing protein [Ferrimonas balearica]|nr:phage integrase SAM-like domain-containing protein [Ferrimonas balearica]